MQLPSKFAMASPGCYDGRMPSHLNHPLRCACGAVQGHVGPGRVGRGVCYCLDCQSFAHFLGKPGDILDAQGGTDVIATLPRLVTLNQGMDKLACMSLSGKGMLRWYAACCNTPIGNTMRDMKFTYVGLVSTCLKDSRRGLDEAFGPVRMRLNTQSAKGEPKPKNTPAGMLAAMLPFMGSVLMARVNGGWKQTPFFGVESGMPVAQPKVLTREERERLRARV